MLYMNILLESDWTNASLAQWHWTNASLAQWQCVRLVSERS